MKNTIAVIVIIVVVVVGLLLLKKPEEASPKNEIGAASKCESDIIWANEQLTPDERSMMKMARYFGVKLRCPHTDAVRSYSNNPEVGYLKKRGWTVV